MESHKNNYFPIQIPYLLNKNFKKSFFYCEEIDPNFEELIICFWKSLPKNKFVVSSENIIIPDGCIDLVVNFTNRTIGLAGMSKTIFDFSVSPTESYFGIRFLPGAVSALFNIEGSLAMDQFIPFAEIDTTFNSDLFWKNQSIDEAILFLKKHLENQLKSKVLDPTYIQLFQSLYANETVPTVAELAQSLAISSRQLQRIFLKEYGLTPNKLLSVIRFQQALQTLKSATGLLEFRYLKQLSYYDQPHFIKSIKKNIGITPKELIFLYIEDASV